MENAAKCGKYGKKCHLLWFKFANLNCAIMIVTDDLTNTNSVGFEIIGKIITRFSHDNFLLIVLLDDLDQKSKISSKITLTNSCTKSYQVRFMTSRDKSLLTYYWTYYNLERSEKYLVRDFLQWTDQLWDIIKLSTLEYSWNFRNFASFRDLSDFRENVSSLGFITRLSASMLFWLSQHPFQQRPVFIFKIVFLVT